MAEAAYKVEASNHFGERGQLLGSAKAELAWKIQSVDKCRKPNFKPKPGDLAVQSDHHLDTIA
jgi:hypothetical protein